MSILDIFFGKKKTVNDAILGAIESERIKDKNQVKVYSWYASYLMPNAPEESMFTMEGNNMEPNPSQLKEIKTILKNIHLLWIKIDEKLNTLSSPEREAFKNCKSNFYLSAIFTNEHNINPNVELFFETIDNNSNAHMSFNYSNGELKEMEIRAPK